MTWCNTRRSKVGSGVLCNGCDVLRPVSLDYLAVQLCNTNYDGSQHGAAMCGYAGCAMGELSSCSS